MNYSKQTTSFVASLVNNYCRYDNLSESFEIGFDDVDREDLYELCALIMLDSEDAAYEACSIENNHYPKMQAALIASLQHPLDPEAQRAFDLAWKEGILSYFQTSITKLLDDAAVNYNQDVAA